jgi:hypothetical protein
VSTLEPEEVVTAVVEDGTVNATDEVIDAITEEAGEEAITILPAPVTPPMPDEGGAGANETAEVGAGAAGAGLEQRITDLENRVQTLEENVQVGTSLPEENGNGGNSTNTTAGGGMDGNATGGAGGNATGMDGGNATEAAPGMGGGNETALPGGTNATEGGGLMR